MPYTQNGGVRIHYRRAGSPGASVSAGSGGGSRNPASTAVLLHGAGADSKLWANQMERLSKRRFCLAPDLRGSGASDMPDCSYDVGMLRDDVLAVLEEEGVDRFHLVGFSMGGLVAQSLADHDPDRILSLALLNCSLGGGNNDIVLPQPQVINMFLYCAALSREDRARNTMDFNFGPRYAEIDPEGYSLRYEEALKDIDGVSCQLPVLVSDEPLIRDYDRIRMPLLCVLSRQDPVTPMANGEVVRKYLPQADVRYLDGYHASPIIHAGKVGRMLDEFMIAAEDRDQAGRTGKLCLEEAVPVLGSA